VYWKRLSSVDILKYSDDTRTVLMYKTQLCTVVMYPLQPLLLEIVFHRTKRKYNGREVLYCFRISKRNETTRVGHSSEMEGARRCDII
jgi:hypothetical protein